MSVELYMMMATLHNVNMLSVDTEHCSHAHHRILQGVFLLVRPKKVPDL